MRDVRWFDRLAPVYDRLMVPTERAPLEYGLAAARRPVERVVDLGGGTGRAARALGGALVVDAAPGMLARARDAGFEVVCGDAGRLPLADATADAVVIVDALHHFPDRRAALAEAARALRPGGVLVVREFDPGTLRGSALALAERAVGFDSSFLGPDALVREVDAAGLDARVLNRGFGYTVAGVKPGEP